MEGGGGWDNSQRAEFEGWECYAGPERGQRNILKKFLNKRNKCLLLQKLHEINFLRYCEKVRYNITCEIIKQYNHLTPWS
jgi:hypothetical protein